MVIMDVRNGDILAMASNPGFDLNEFIPGMSKARFEELKNDPREPLGGRAYQGNYFPASTFKIVTALAGLESNKVPADKFYFCDTSFTIGDRTFHNWNTKSAEGDLNVVAAIKRSCNTFFYQAAMDIGTTDLIGMAERMGFGVPTGIPLAGEAKGFVPTDAFYQQRYKHRILPGILASISIGQVVEASPLQVAQCMATVADGTNMPKVRLVKQVQDFNDNVIQAWPPEVRKQVGLRQDARDTVVKGMIAVVNSDGGTGHNAQVEGVQVAGKTGTAQWKLYPDESKNRRLAWFTGFLPAQNPLYAFAVVYEGAPGENVSGGAIAAPVVQEVFEKIYKNASPEDDLILMAKEAPRAEIVDDTVDVVGAPKAEPVAEAPQPTEQPKTVGGFFRRLFGGSRQ
jgi:penicillin-binding protein 2